jgi:hypothetical protein
MEVPMIRLRLAVLAGSALALATTAAGAQTRRSAVPSSMLPPSGLCRVWIEGVEPMRQPPVTDCASARANLRSNSRVIYGGSSNGRVDMSREERMRYEAQLREEARLREVARLRDQSRSRNDDRYSNDDRYRNGDRSYNDAQRRDRDLQKAEEKRLKALEKSERKRDKAIEKGRKHDGDDRNDHRRGDSNERGR